MEPCKDEHRYSKLGSEDLFSFKKNKPQTIFIIHHSLYFAEKLRWSLPITSYLNLHLEWNHNGHLPTKALKALHQFKVFTAF